MPGYKSTPTRRELVSACEAYPDLRMVFEGKHLPARRLGTLVLKSFGRNLRIPDWFATIFGCNSSFFRRKTKGLSPKSRLVALLVRLEWCCFTASKVSRRLFAKLICPDFHIRMRSLTLKGLSARVRTLARLAVCIRASAGLVRPDGRIYTLVCNPPIPD